MKKFCCLLFPFLFLNFSTEVESVSVPDRKILMFWNLENLFVPWGGPDSLVAEFRYGGKRGWSYSRYLKKCAAIAKTVVYLEDSLGRRPDFIAVAEIENRTVLHNLVSLTPLHGYPYLPVHYDSPDRRGIDVGLLYDSSRYRLVSSCAWPVMKDSVILATRSILYACFVRKVHAPFIRDTAGADARADTSVDARADTLHIFVNHHPSKFSGAEASQPLRDAAMRLLASLADSVAVRHPGHEVVLTGDFNDVPSSAALKGAPGFVNLSYSLHEEGFGSIKYAGKWELIDHFIVSPQLAGRCSTYVFSPAFLLEKDRKGLGYKPCRTYIGPRYNGGVSDHLPIVLEIFY